MSPWTLPPQSLSGMHVLSASNFHTSMISLFPVTYISLGEQRPPSFKHATITPILKQTSPLSNYGPIFFLRFGSKLLEQNVSHELSSHLSSNALLDSMQSGVWPHHPTETALTKITNDLLTAKASRHCSVFLLLALSSAFDTVDHCPTLCYKFFPHLASDLALSMISSPSELLVSLTSVPPPHLALSLLVSLRGHSWDHYSSPSILLAWENTDSHGFQYYYADATYLSTY